MRAWFFFLAIALVHCGGRTDLDDVGGPYGDAAPGPRSQGTSDAGAGKIPDAASGKEMPGSFTTTVDGGTPLSGLTPSQQTQLCQDISSYATTTLGTDECKVFAFAAAQEIASIEGTTSASTLEETCFVAGAECAQILGGADAGANTATCSAGALAASQCSATVSDLTGCLDDLGDVSSQLAAAVPSCLAITAASLATIDAGAAALPLRCLALEEECGSATSMLPPLLLPR